MNYVILTFEFLRDFYTRVFADFLHVHYMIRTVFLLLVAWLIIMVVLKIFKYIAGPLVVLLFYHTVFRFYNYFFVETPAEWIYIQFYSKDLPTLEKAYLRLTGKMKRNRETLNKLSYGKAIVKVKNTEKRTAYFLLTAATLWITAFGLYIEFFPEPLEHVLEPPAIAARPPDTPEHLPGNGANINENNTGYSAANEEMYNIYIPGTLSPAGWGSGSIILVLNENGRQGAWLRSGPGISGFVVTEVLWGDIRLVYRHYFVPDNYVSGLYWLRVLTPNGNTGYLSSSLVEVYG